MTDIEINAVTSSLERLVAGISATASVTTQPPDMARTATTGEQINIYLYGVRFDASLRNAGIRNAGPGRASPAQDIALCLDYLLTAYGANDDDLSAQRLLGRTMGLLHDRAVLGPSDIVVASGEPAPRGRIEQVQLMPREADMPALWSSLGFGAYRLSVAYEARVVFRSGT